MTARHLALLALPCLLAACGSSFEGGSGTTSTTTDAGGAGHGAAASSGGQGHGGAGHGGAVSTGGHGHGGTASGGSGGQTAAGGQGGHGSAGGLPNGAACKKLASGCASGFCAPEGVCCDAPCNGPCEECGSGHCAAIAAGVPDTSPQALCTGSQACDGKGACKSIDGVACGADDACVTGHCSLDSVCCAVPCAGTCQVCGPSKGLTCTPVPAGQQGPGCGSQSQACDGQGNCKKALGTECVGDPECASMHCVLRPRGSHVD